MRSNFKKITETEGVTPNTTGWSTFVMTKK